MPGIQTMSKRAINSLLSNSLSLSKKRPKIKISLAFVNHFLWSKHWIPFVIQASRSQFLWDIYSQNVSSFQWISCFMVASYRITNQRLVVMLPVFLKYFPSTSQFSPVYVQRRWFYGSRFGLKRCLVICSRHAILPSPTVKMFQNVSLTSACLAFTHRNPSLTSSALFKMASTASVSPKQMELTCFITSLLSVELSYLTIRCLFPWYVAYSSFVSVFPS